MEPIKSILVGIDLSGGDHFIGRSIKPHCLEALQQGIRIASSAKAKLILAATLEIPRSSQSATCEESDPYADLKAEAALVMQAHAQLAVQAGVRCEVKISIGSAWEELSRTAIQESADLVLVGSRKHSIFERWILGTTAQRLIRVCHTPVWLAVEDLRPDTNRILVACDLTETDLRMVRLADELASLLGARLFVLHALEHFHDKSQAVAHTQKHRDVAIKGALDRLNELIAGLPLKCKPTTLVKEALADMAIKEAITEHEIDLLVIATARESGILNFLLGTTAARLIEEPPCSMLVMKPAGFQSPLGN